MQIVCDILTENMDYLYISVDAKASLISDKI